MIVRHEYFLSELRRLFSEFERENVLISQKRDGIIVKNMHIPAKYGRKDTSIYLIVPEGFGYGINIIHSYVYLPKNTGKHHLFGMGDELQREVRRRFRLPENNPYSSRKKQWFWICLHLAEERNYTRLIRLEKEDVEHALNERKTDLVGFVEHINIVRVVLKQLADGDPSILQQVREMNENREKIVAESERRIREFVLSNNWKKMRWMY